jgi:ferredoxin
MCAARQGAETMSDSYNPAPAGAPGRFRITSACTHCGGCTLLAPGLIGGGDSEWKILAHLIRQPEAPAEVAACLAALAACPCEAIVDTGA